MNLTTTIRPRCKGMTAGPWSQDSMPKMRPLNQLQIGPLLALKTALDGYQRYEAEPPIANYFSRILDALIGPLTEINIWAIRTLINEEDARRSKQAGVKAINPDVYQHLSKLGKQELTILRLVGQGYQNETIADLLGVSYRTVANHKAHITTKLGLGTSKDLPKFAIDNLTL